MRRRGAFTLIEVLIVVAIIAVLSGMAMSMLGMGRRVARRSATESVLMKVDAALRQFKTDFKAYPWQRDYPPAGEDTGWTNRLYHHVGSELTPEERDHIVADMDEAGRQYRMDCRVPWGTGENHPATPHVFRTDRHSGLPTNHEWGWPVGDVAPVGTYFKTSANRWYFQYENTLATCVMLNRMGGERARLLMLIGHVEAGGVKMVDVTWPCGLTHPGRDVSGVPLVDPAKRRSGDRPGWAMDYLQGELPRRHIDGETILDAYGNPLAYVCQVQPGVKSSQAKPINGHIAVWAPQWYGLTPIGRKRLHADAPADPAGGLPDPSDLRRSDRTTYAAEGYEYEFELWSAGPDGRLDRMRDASVNRDNIGAARYDEGLQR